MKMKHIIKITETQLREAEGDAFKYLDVTDDAKPYNGQSAITAQGKIDGDENAEPIFTDRISKQRTPQSWARYRMYGNINKPASTEPKNIDYNMFEGVEINNVEQGDNNNDKIDDMYSDVANMGQGGTDVLSNGNNEDNLTVLPSGIDRRIDGLIKMIKQMNLPPRKIAMVINKFQDAFPELADNPEFIKKYLRQQVDPNDIKDFD